MRLRLDWKLRRIAAGFRQQDLAARIGVSSSRYSALERGQVNPKEWEAEALERLLPPLSQSTLPQPHPQTAVGRRP
jgi:DNA-binding XRE family transcriptional regulator